MLDVRSQTEEQARTFLESQGFEVRTEEVSSSLPKGQVLSTDPAAGTSVDEGTTITLTVSLGDSFVVPDLTNQSVNQATDTLKGAGWTGDRGRMLQRPENTLDPT